MLVLYDIYQLTLILLTLLQITSSKFALKVQISSASLIELETH